GAAPSIDVVDDGLRRPEDGLVEKRIVGQMPSVVFDASGSLLITHLDAVTRRVLFTEQEGDGWLTTPLGASVEGFETDIVTLPTGVRYVVGVNRANPNGELQLQRVVLEPLEVSE